MNIDIKGQWIAALRSGDYKQGAGSLQRDKKYCCLGVLCDLAEKAGIVESVEGDDVTYFNPDEPEDRMIGALPDAVVQWAGLRDADPYLSRLGEGKWRASGWNDTVRSTFDEIADMIEVNL